VLADQCTVLSDPKTLPWDSTSPTRGTRLRAIRNHFCGGGAARSVTAASWAALVSALRPKYLPEAVGQALAPMAKQKVSEQLRSGYVTPCNGQEMVVTLPKRKGRINRQAA
jgi:hypothetical protein